MFLLVLPAPSCKSFLSRSIDNRATYLGRCNMKKDSGRVIVRPIAEDEIPEMIDVWKASGLPYKPRGRDSLRNLTAQRKDDPDLFLGAFVSGRMVGVALASDDGRRAWINRVAVIPQARRRGVALALIDRAEKIMKRRGRRLFCMQVEAQNQLSMRLLKRAGYRHEHEILYFTKREKKSY